MDTGRLVRRSRLVVGAATVVGVAAWFWVGAVDDDVPLGVLYAALVTPFALAIVHAVLFRRLWWRARRAPAEFLTEGDALRPARAQSPYGGILIVGASIVGGRFGALRDHSDVVEWLGLAVFTLITAQLATTVFRKSALALTADGVVHGKHLTRWDDLWPDGPAVPGPRAWALPLPVRPSARHPAAEVRGVSSATWQRLRDRGLDTNVNAILAEDPSLLRPEDPAAGPQNPAAGPVWVTVDLRGVAIDRTFLVDAIRFYRQTPAARAEIGTPGGIGVPGPHEHGTE